MTLIAVLSIFTFILWGLCETAIYANAIASGSIQLLPKGGFDVIVPRPERHSGEYLMTKTLISSDKQEITIGFDAPFCVIGERINLNRRKLAAEMAAGDYSGAVRCGCTS